MIENIASLEKVYSAISKDDSSVFIRSNEYSAVLSYNAKINRLTDVFQDPSILADLKNEVLDLLDSLKELSASMLTRDEASQIYASKDEYDLKKEQILTQSNADSLMKKYVTENIMKSKAAEIRAESSKMADEMTDFTGAAMVGINQSNAGLQEPSEGETKKNKG